MKYLLLPVLSIFSLFMFSCVENQEQLWQQSSRILNAVVADQRPLTTEEIGHGLKEALKVGSETVVSQLGAVDGFNLDPAVHIPLPKKLTKVQSALDSFGLSYLLDDLELKLNRAAEVAAPKARALFWQAITNMTFDDILGIYNGPDDAATRYFMRSMSGSLSQAMQPVIDSSLAEVGAIKSYEHAIERYRTLPFVPDVRTDLTDYVTGKGIEGIFYYLAREEKAIRNDPVKRTTEILQRVFGSG